jgi:hypothetical protein
VDTLEFFPHNYQMPQLSSANRLIMAAKYMTDALQNPHPEVPFARVGHDTILALTDLAAIFKLNSISHASSFASEGHYTPMHCSIIKPNLRLSHAPIATNEISDNNSNTRHLQRAITSEGGHT